MKLKDSVLENVKKSDRIRVALMNVHDKRESTVLRWIRTNSFELTHYKSLQVISAYLATDIDDLIVYEECDFKQVV